MNFDNLPSSSKGQHAAVGGARSMPKEPHSGAMSTHSGRLPPKGELSRGSSSTSLMMSSLATAQSPQKSSKTNLASQKSRRNGTHGLHSQSPVTPGNSSLDDYASKRKGSDSQSLVNSDKKRLVQQFYDTMNDNSITKNSSFRDLNDILSTKNLNSPIPPTGSSVSPDMRKPAFGSIMRDIIASGGFSGLSPQLPGQNDLGETLDYLLNIDTVLQNISTQKSNTDLLALGEFLESLNMSLMVFTDSTTSVVGTARPSQSLDSLSEFLDNLASYTDQLVHEITNVSDNIRYTKQNETQVDIRRIESLAENLSYLEAKLASLKASINSDKHLMSNVILEKIEVLDYVNQKFREHAKITRDRQLKNFYILLSLLVILISIYLIYRRT